MLLLWTIVIALGVLAAHLWHEDWKETHAPRKRTAGIWGRPPIPAMAVGRHRR